MSQPDASSHASREPNRLAAETSPYLLQHAYNPVDWRPWGDEAFEEARRLDRPVFLSVGYSACHWCHVMERESFEDEAIAELLNSRFVSIKVDREERPDVDQIYMTAVQALTQRGGWPMSVFLTPDRQPFFGGTYWPPRARMGMQGFHEILQAIDDAWQNRRQDVRTSAASLTEAVARMSAMEFDPAELSVDLLRNAMRALLRTFDARYGGFGGAPKFPHPMDLRVLLRCWKRFGDADALDAARLTLDRMVAGGIYDHLGGGFHRYSTDARWLVPHFEKMLYDNALLVPAYLELWQIERRPDDARVVRETLDYVLREMTSPEGPFFSTQDADSEGEEGRFFVWSVEEIESLLETDDARVFCYAYDVAPGGNWEGASILNRPKPSDQAAAVLGMSADELDRRLSAARAVLFEARGKRVAPGRDDKVLVSWNGLMIAAMARAGAVLGEPRYAAAAARAADCLLANVRDEQGRLLHSWKDGRARFRGYLDDSACLIDGLVELQQATSDARWIDAALELADRMIRDFAADDGGFFYTAGDHEALIARTRDVQDNATPSGAAMAAFALLRLGRLASRTDLEERGYRTLQAVSGLMAEHPRAAGQSLLALDFHLGPSPEVVLAEPTSGAADPLVAEVRQRFLPGALLLRTVSGEPVPEWMAPLVANRRPVSGAATAYVCERGLCREPCTDPAALGRLLDS
ncbi:MAG: thioredoxin domain-containing protein [Planctomyces sp.]|nr:thioredoxin domain-containing protein [Planctomyces sp.]